MSDEPTERARRLLDECRTRPESVPVAEILDLVAAADRPDREAGLECLRALEDGGVPTHKAVGERLADADPNDAAECVTALAWLVEEFPDRTTIVPSGLGELFGSRSSVDGYPEAPIGKYFRRSATSLPATAIEALGEQLVADDADRRRLAANALSKAAAADPTAVEPALDPLLGVIDDPDPTVRTDVSKTLVTAVELAPNRITDALADGLERTGTDVAETICVGIWDSDGDLPEPLLDPLLTALSERADRIDRSDDGRAMAAVIAFRRAYVDTDALMADRIADFVALLSTPGPANEQSALCLADIAQEEPAAIEPWLDDVRTALVEGLPATHAPDGAQALHRILCEAFGPDYVDGLGVHLAEIRRPDPSTADDRAAAASELLVATLGDSPGTLAAVRRGLDNRSRRVGALLTLARAAGDDGGPLLDDRFADALDRTLGDSEVDDETVATILEHLADAAAVSPDAGAVLLPVLIRHVPALPPVCRSEGIRALSPLADRHEGAVPERLVRTLRAAIVEAESREKAENAATALAGFGHAETVVEVCRPLLDREASDIKIGLAGLTALDEIPAAHREPVVETVVDVIDRSTGTDDPLADEALENGISVLASIAAVVSEPFGAVDADRLDRLCRVAELFAIDPEGSFGDAPETVLFGLFDGGVIPPSATADRLLSVAETGRLAPAYGERLPRDALTVSGDTVQSDWSRAALSVLAKIGFTHPDAVSIERIAPLIERPDLDRSRGAVDVLAHVVHRRPDAVAAHATALLDTFERYLDGELPMYVVGENAAYARPTYAPFYAVVGAALMSERETVDVELLTCAVDRATALELVELVDLGLDVGNVALNAPDVLPSLVDLLDTGEPRLRSVAARGISKALEDHTFVHTDPYPAAVEEILPALVERVAHPDDAVCECVIHALGEVTHEPIERDRNDSAVEGFPAVGIEALPRAVAVAREREDIEITKSVTFLLARVATVDGSAAADHVDWCVDLFERDGEPRHDWDVVYSNAAGTIAAVATEYPDRVVEATPALIAQLPDREDSTGTKRAVEALSRIAENRPEAVADRLSVADLVGLLHDDHFATTRAEAANLLGRLGETGLLAVPAETIDELRVMSDDEDGAVRSAALTALERLGA